MKHFTVYKELIDDKKFTDFLFDPKKDGVYSNLLYHGIRHDGGINKNYWVFTASDDNPNWDNFIFKLGVIFQKSLKQ
jgi:hypothetical protein